jgi:hypothetical protein
LVLLKYWASIATQKTMTAITLSLSPDLEQKLRSEAAKEGLEPDCYIVNALQERFQSNPMLEKATEADRLQQINIGLSAETWAQYHTLIAKRHDETFSPQEHADLIQLRIASKNSMSTEFKHLSNSPTSATNP